MTPKPGEAFEELRRNEREFRIAMVAASTMKRTFPNEVWRAAFAVAIVFFGLILGCAKPQPFENISLVSESPDQRVWLYEHPNRLDRNFDVWIERKRDGFRTNIFQSPDEGMPMGTERIIWNRDHSEFVLVGREFMVEGYSRIGLERPYLWYSLETQKLFCNSSQVNHPRFSEEDLNWDGYHEKDVYRNANPRR